MALRGIQRMGPWILLVVLWTSAFCLAARLVNEETGMDVSASIFEQFLSAGRVALSEQLYETADLYFHKGVPHKSQAGLTNSVFQQWREQIAPTPHVHPQWVEVNEIAPWLRFSTQIDPQNVEAYLVASYWIGDQGQRPDIAEAILLEARVGNPGDFRILAELGRNYMIMEDAEKASAAYDAAINVWPSHLDPGTREVRLQLAQMLSYRAFLYELNGDVDGALKLFRRAAEMFPDNKTLSRRIRELESGRSNREWAEEAWAELFPRSQTCARMEHDKEHHDHEHVHTEECGHLHGHEHEHGHEH